MNTTARKSRLPRTPLFVSYTTVAEFCAYGLSISGLRKMKYIQDAQLSQRDRAAGCVIVFPKSRRLQLGDNILRTV